jgi:NAD(P)-dependent dehydrogenase (short-subunit alcohol dehydrogenase family)
MHGTRRSMAGGNLPPSWSSVARDGSVRAAAGEGFSRSRQGETYEAHEEKLYRASREAPFYHLRELRASSLPASCIFKSQSRGTDPATCGTNRCTSAVPQRHDKRRIDNGETPHVAPTIRDANPSDAANCGRVLYAAFEALADHHRFPRAFPSVEIATGRSAMLLSHPGYYGVVAEAVIQMTRELSTEWAGRGVRVNCILPAQVLGANGLGPRMEADPWLRDTFLRGIPAGRFGQPDDIKGVALLLASDAGDWITGAAMPMDGGNLAMNAGGGLLAPIMERYGAKR